MLAMFKFRLLFPLPFIVSTTLYMCYRITIWICWAIIMHRKSMGVPCIDRIN